MKYVVVTLAVLLSLAMAVPLGVLLWLKYGLWALAFYAAMFVALPLSSLLHEAGHMLFGALVKIKAVPHFSLFGSSSCEIIPRTDKNLKARVFFTAIGGLIINLLFVVPEVIAVCVPSCPYWVGILSPASAYLLILNVFPVQYAGGATDGLVCWNLLDDDNDETKVMLAVLSVQAQILNGKDIGDIDRDLLFDLPQISEDSQSFIALCELCYKYCEATGDGENAQKYKDRFEQLKNDYL